jgi:competence protein ComEA
MRGMKLSRIMFQFCLALLPALLSASTAKELQKLENVKLVESAANDGDSFIVEAGEERLHLRLYYVDCPEIKADRDALKRRVREQSRYFGLVDPQKMIEFGKQARQFTMDQLTEPFTVYTSYAKTPGGAASRRIYAFVVTSEGEYLDRLLVKMGLARPVGKARRTPDDIHHEEMIEQMRDMEASAIWRRRGIWGETDPERMIELRAQLREEEREIEAIGKVTASYPLDINTATRAELETLNGIGETMSKRIVEARPFKSLDDLYSIERMPSNTVNQIKDKLYISNPGK